MRKSKAVRLAVGTLVAIQLSFGLAITLGAHTCEEELINQLIDNQAIYDNCVRDLGGGYIAQGLCMAGKQQLDNLSWAKYWVCSI